MIFKGISRSQFDSDLLSNRERETYKFSTFTAAHLVRRKSRFSFKFTSEIRIHQSLPFRFQIYSARPFRKLRPLISLVVPLNIKPGILIVHMATGLNPTEISKCTTKTMKMCYYSQAG